MRTYTVPVIFALILAVVLGAGCTDTTTTLPQNQSEATPTLTPAPVSSSTASPEELVAFVEKAFEYAHVHGQEAALREFNNQTGQFVDGELYIFAYDINGTTLALPFQPEIIGTNRWNVTRTAPYLSRTLTPPHSPAEVLSDISMKTLQITSQSNKNLATL